MSRILIAWELGANWGHLSRLSPLAASLKSRGHSVLAMVPDVAAASTALGAADVTFIQSPGHVGVRPVGARATGYADVLLSQGWEDRSALWGMLQAWINIYRLFRPDVIVLDYAPTARLAAEVSRIPTVMTGSGYELPPATSPLPPFPGFSWATQEAAAASERRVLDSTNAVLRACHAEPILALRQLLDADARFLTTFAELDQYGPRAGERYIGPMADPRQGRSIDWPTGSQRRVFAYLRPDVPDFAIILEGLAAGETGVIAYVPGIARDTLIRLGNPRCVLCTEPVQFSTVFQAADACLSYASAGTVTMALLYGVPQLMVPVHIESQLTAQRVALQGMGRVLQKPKSSNDVVLSLHQLLDSTDTRLRAREFAERHRAWSAAAAIGVVVDAIEAQCARTLRQTAAPRARFRANAAGVVQ
jgi:UDP:flavonoid glycosyltransferase YjiC (YdhE family)